MTKTTFVQEKASGVKNCSILLYISELTIYKTLSNINISFYLL